MNGKRVVYLINHGGIHGGPDFIEFELISNGTFRGLLALTVGIYTYWICEFIKKQKMILKEKALYAMLLLGEIVSVLGLLYTFIFQTLSDNSDFNVYFYAAFIIGLLYFKKERLLKFLSWKIWQPFGRISYMLYLTHFIIIDILKTNCEEWARSNLVVTYLLITVLTVLFAFGCSWEQKWCSAKLKKLLLKKS